MVIVMRDPLALSSLSRNPDFFCQNLKNFMISKFSKNFKNFSFQKISKFDSFEKVDFNINVHGDYKFYENFEFFGNFCNLEIF
jgi:hypothetical protein